MNLERMTDHLNAAMHHLEDAAHEAAGLSPDDQLRLRELVEHVLYETKRVKNLDRYAHSPRLFQRVTPIREDVVFPGCCATYFIHGGRIERPCPASVVEVCRLCGRGVCKAHQGRLAINANHVCEDCIVSRHR